MQKVDKKQTYIIQWTVHVHTLSEICTIERSARLRVPLLPREYSKCNCQHSPSHDSLGHSHPSPGQGERDKSELDCVFVVTNYELSIGAIRVYSYKSQVRI